MEVYEVLDKDVRRSVWKDKHNMIENLASEAEEAAMKNNTRELYKIMKKLSGKHNISNSSHIKDNN